jgi:hypothetical protein
MHDRPALTSAVTRMRVIEQHGERHIERNDMIPTGPEFGEHVIELLWTDPRMIDAIFAVRAHDWPSIDLMEHQCRYEGRGRSDELEFARCDQIARSAW